MESFSPLRMTRIMTVIVFPTPIELPRFTLQRTSHPHSGTFCQSSTAGIHGIVHILDAIGPMMLARPDAYLISRVTTAFVVVASRVRRVDVEAAGDPAVDWTRG